MSELARQRMRTAMVVVAVLVVVYILWSARGALVPFLIGAIIAYLLAPLVNLVSLIWPLNKMSVKAARGTAIALIYLVFFGLLVLFAFLLAPRIIAEMDDLIDSAPRRIDEITEFYEENVSEDIQERVSGASDDASQGIQDYATGLVAGTAGLILATISVILGYFLIPFWLFYYLRDQDENSENFYELFPENIRQDARNCVAIINRIGGRYIRARLIEASFIGFSITIGLYLLNIEFALALGILAGTFELVPFAGPVLGAIPALVVAATGGDLQTVIFVFLLFFGVQQLQQAFIVPNVEGHAVDMHPALVIFIVVVGGAVAGFWGLLLGVPAVAITRDLFRYIYRRLDGWPQEVVFAQLTTGRSVTYEGQAEPPSVKRRRAGGVIGFLRGQVAEITPDDEPDKDSSGDGAAVAEPLTPHEKREAEKEQEEIAQSVSDQ